MNSDLIEKESKTEKQELSEYYLLLFQSEYNNLISTGELGSEIFETLIKGLDDLVLENDEYMDLYLCENLFSTLLPGLEALSKTVEKLIYHSKREDEREVNRFNPCNFLGEFLMRNNPRYGKNQETHQKFKVFTRKERKNRMTKGKLSILEQKVIKICNETKISINKVTINDFVKEVDSKLGLKDTLKGYNWKEHFRVNKDKQVIQPDQFFEAFHKALLTLHEITEEMVSDLLKEK